MTEPMKAYIAAMIDAEGVIGFTRIAAFVPSSTMPHRYFGRVIVTNSHFGLISFLKTTSGLGSVQRSKKNPTNPNWSPIHRWNVAAKACRLLLAEIRPYLVIKRKQAELVLALPRRLPGSPQDVQIPIYRRQEQLFAQCAELNRRGVKKHEVTAFPPDHPLLLASV